MEISSMIVTALALGATSGIKGVTEKSIKDAYAALINLLDSKFKDKVNLDLLEKSPESLTRQAVVKEDIVNCGADKDKEVLLAVKSLFDLIIKSQDLSSSLVGVSLDDVQAFNIRVKDVMSEGSGVVIQHAKAKGDIQIEGVVSGKKKTKVAKESTNILNDVTAQNIEIVNNKNYYGAGITETSSAKLKHVRNFFGHTYHINTLSLQNDILVSGGGDTKAIVWNILTGKKIFTAEHNSWVGSVGVIENYLVTSTGKGQINVWKYDDGIQIMSITAHDGAIRTIAISSNQKFLFSGGKDSKIKMWSFPELNLVNEFCYHQSEVRRLAVDYSGTTIFSGDSKGNVFMFDINSQREKQILNLEGQMIRSVTFSDKYKLLALAISTGEVVVLDTENEIVKWRVQGHNGQSIGIAFHPEKEIIATGGQDKTIRLWNLENGAIIDSIVGHSNTVTSLVFSQNGKWLLSSSRDEIISMWQVL